MKVIVTGASGMVGHAVLIEAIESHDVSEIVLINRRTLAIDHPKIRELLHADFGDFGAIASHFEGVDACFHCMGVSSAGLDEAHYTHLTYDTSKALADVLMAHAPQCAMFYISGDGTNESSSTMWARVKGRTETMLLDAGFRDAYMYRAGAILPLKGVRSKTKLYQLMYDVMRPFFPLLKRIDSITTSVRLAQSMLYLAQHPIDKKVLYNPDINAVAKSLSL
ncbi:MAG: epimerase [Sulfuricurvum sp. PC08-66]|nr:MAG: epimerase [Sulfuricurvum sp. PC08-66]